MNSYREFGLNRVLVALGAVVGVLWALWEDDERLPGNVFFFSFTATVAVFIVLYAARSPWRLTEMGRALMYLMCACLLVGVNVSLALIFGPDYPGRYDIRNVLLLAAALTVANMLMIVFRLQQETRRLAVLAASSAEWAEYRPGIRP